MSGVAAAAGLAGKASSNPAAIAAHGVEPFPHFQSTEDVADTLLAYGSSILGTDSSNRFSIIAGRRADVVNFRNLEWNFFEGLAAAARIGVTNGDILGLLN